MQVHPAEHLYMLSKYQYKMQENMQGYINKSYFLTSLKYFKLD